MICPEQCSQVVMLTGLGFLFAAIANNRLENVEDYGHGIQEWQTHDRPLLEETRINMTATWFVFFVALVCFLR